MGNWDDSEVEKRQALTRRRFLLGMGVLAGAAVASPKLVFGAVHRPVILRLENLHTGEKLAATYREGGRLLPDAMAEINEVLRDHRTGEVTGMDPALLDYLSEVARVTGSDGRFQVISGYRSPATNAMLRSRGNGVAKRSLHMDGRAIDVRLDGVPLKRLRSAAMSVRRGGVGYYPRSNFVHLDTGAFRSW
jgi:uncharacterized protein YcbK (DUF882 family)